MPITQVLICYTEFHLHSVNGYQVPPQYGYPLNLPRISSFSSLCYSPDGKLELRSLEWEELPLGIVLGVLKC